MSIRTVEIGNPASNTVIVFLAGFGDVPEKFLPLFENDFPLDARVVLCEPHQHGNAGPYWYNVDENGPDENEVQQATAAVNQLCRSLQSSLPSASAQIVLGGFSQGGALAAATCLASTTFSPAGFSPTGLFVFSGYLANNDDIHFEQMRSVPVFVSHGEDDDMVDTIRGRSLAKAFGQAESLVMWTPVEGGHRLAPEAFGQFTKWLDSLLAGRPLTHPLS